MTADDVKRDANGNVIDEHAEWFRDEITQELPLPGPPETRTRVALPEPEPPHPSGLPFLTPETYARVNCRCAMCDVCRWFQGQVEGRASAAAWIEKAYTLERDFDRPRFRNEYAALEVYVRVREDGYQAAGLGPRIEALHALGTSIDGNSPPRPPAVTLAAEDAAAVESALLTLYMPPADRGIGRRACVEILLARTVGRLVIVRGKDGRGHRKAEQIPAASLAERYAITETTVGAIVKSGMRGLRVELAARDLIPMPSARAGLAEEIHRRRQKLSREAT